MAGRRASVPAVGPRRPPPWSGSSGDPVAHSLSPLLHNTAFDALGLDWVSVGFPVPAGCGGRARWPACGPWAWPACRSPCPTRATVAGLVDECTPVAERLGAVNCVRWAERAPGRGQHRRGGLRGLAAARGRLRSRGPALPGGRGRRGRPGRRAGPGRGRGGRGGGGQPHGRARPPRPPPWPAGRGRVGDPAEAPGMDLVVEATPVGMAGAAGECRRWSTPGGCRPGQVVADLVYHPVVTPCWPPPGPAGPTWWAGSGCSSTRPRPS